MNESSDLLDPGELVVSVDEEEFALASVTPNGMPIAARAHTLTTTDNTIQRLLLAFVFLEHME